MASACRAAALLAVLPQLFYAAATFPRRDPATAAYPHYGGQRKVLSLTGSWDFDFLNYTDYNASDPLDLSKVAFRAQQHVPAAWDSEWGTGLQYSRGAGVYRATLPIGADNRALLHFEACSLFCRVYIDGALVHTSSLGGFTPFWVEVPPSEGATAAGTRTVVVMASNVFDPVLTPTQYVNYDFYQYGGLLREVTLHVLPAAVLTSIERVTVTPLAMPMSPAVPSAKVDVVVTLRGGRAAGGSVVLGLCWDIGPTAPPCADARQYTATDGAVTLRGVAVPDAKVWDPTDKAPALHTLTVTLHGSGSVAATVAAPTAVLDSCQVRFGIRIVSRSGRHILVNGRRVKLHGYNRHDMYPQVGPAISSSLYDADLTLLQGPLNGNFIRGSHYPQDPRFLDKCDERGVLVWEEALGWGNWETQLVDPTFMAAQLGTANAMLDRDTNHPSIILWGFFNEGQTDRNQSCPSYAAMATTFKSRDPSRLVTWADNRGPASLCLDHADVVSFNYYPGWYNGPGSPMFGATERPGWRSTIQTSHSSSRRRGPAALWAIITDPPLTPLNRRDGRSSTRLWSIVPTPWLR